MPVSLRHPAAYAKAPVGCQLFGAHKQSHDHQHYPDQDEPDRFNPLVVIEAVGVGCVFGSRVAVHDIALSVIKYQFLYLMRTCDLRAIRCIESRIKATGIGASDKVYGFRIANVVLRDCEIASESYIVVIRSIYMDIGISTLTTSKDIEGRIAIANIFAIDIAHLMRTDSAPEKTGDGQDGPDDDQAPTSG